MRERERGGVMSSSKDRTFFLASISMTMFVQSPMTIVRRMAAEIEFVFFVRVDCHRQRARRERDRGGREERKRREVRRMDQDRRTTRRDIIPCNDVPLLCE